MWTCDRRRLTCRMRDFYVCEFVECNFHGRGVATMDLGLCRMTYRKPPPAMVQIKTMLTLVSGEGTTSGSNLSGISCVNAVL